MRGFSSWMRSQVKPMRSSAPGAKFSTSTSQVLIRRSSTSLPLGSLVLTVTERLLWFSIVKYRLSTSGMSRSWPRVASPSPAFSTLITSAPNQASSWVQVGPDCTCVKSRIRTPSRALLIETFLGKLAEASFVPCLCREARVYAFFGVLCGFRLVMRPLSVPAVSSITALISVGLPLATASASALDNSAVLVACTPTPPKASINLL